MKNVSKMRNTLRWFGHLERMSSNKFIKKVYVSENENPNKIGMPAVR